MESKPDAAKVLILILLLLPVIYLASYLCLLTPRYIANAEGYWRQPRYRFQSPLTDAVFLPASWLDQKIRPGFWSGDLDEDLGLTVE
jgi:hypothetical protein